MAVDMIPSLRTEAGVAIRVIARGAGIPALADRITRINIAKSA